MKSPESTCSLDCTAVWRGHPSDRARLSYRRNLITGQVVQTLFVDELLHTKRKEDTVVAHQIIVLLLYRFARTLGWIVLCSLLAVAAVALAEDTCNSVKGQEDYAYVWTLGVPGVGDGWDRLVTIDVNPVSPQYGKVSE